MYVWLKKDNELQLKSMQCTSVTYSFSFNIIAHACRTRVTKV